MSVKSVSIEEVILDSVFRYILFSVFSGIFFIVKWINFQNWLPIAILYIGLNLLFDYLDIKRIKRTAV